MKTKLFWTISFFLFFALTGKGVENPDSLFYKANQAYQKQLYSKAAKLYDSLYKTGYSSPALLFNLGNTYYKLDRIPEAILFYEKAQKVTGYRKDIQHNLALAREQITDKIEPGTPTLITKWWNQAVQYFSLDIWGNLTILLIWIAVLSFGTFLFLGISGLRKLSLIIGILAFIFFIGSLIMTVERYQYTTKTRHGIIFSPSVYVKSAPDVESKDLFILHAGVKVELENELDDWKKIRLPDGKQGWVRKSSLRKI